MVVRQGVSSITPPSGTNMGVSKNRGVFPKSSISKKKGFFSIINKPSILGVFAPIFGNIHIYIYPLPFFGTWGHFPWFPSRSTSHGWWVPAEVAFVEHISGLILLIWSGQTPCFFWNVYLKVCGHFQKLGVPPKHPKIMILSRKTHGCWVPPF